MKAFENVYSHLRNWLGLDETGFFFLRRKSTPFALLSFEAFPVYRSLGFPKFFSQKGVTLSLSLSFRRRPCVTFWWRSSVIEMKRKESRKFSCSGLWRHSAKDNFKWCVGTFTEHSKVNFLFAFRIYLHITFYLLYCIIISDGRASLCVSFREFSIVKM